MIRTMRSSDMGFVLNATNEMQWAYSRVEIERVISLSNGVSYVWEDEELRGFITSLIYSSTAIIGHLFVTAGYRGIGIGKSLLEHALSVLDSSGVESVIVFSTEDGSGLYEQMGFSKGPKVVSYGMNVTGPLSRLPGAESVLPEDLDEIAAFDERIFGDSRINLMERLYAEHPDLCRKIVNDGTIDGYIFARRTPLGGDIGPWICGAPDASHLLSSVMSSFECSRVDIGYFEDNPWIKPLIDSHAQVKNFNVRLMTRGLPRYTGDRTKVFGIAGFELG